MCLRSSLLAPLPHRRCTESILLLQDWHQCGAGSDSGRVPCFSVEASGIPVQAAHSRAQAVRGSILAAAGGFRWGITGAEGPFWAELNFQEIKVIMRCDCDSV